MNNLLSVILALAFTAGVFLIPALWHVFAAKGLLALMIDGGVPPVMTTAMARRDLQILN